MLENQVERSGEVEQFCGIKSQSILSVFFCRGPILKQIHQFRIVVRPIRASKHEIHQAEYRINFRVISIYIALELSAMITMKCAM